MKQLFVLPVGFLVLALASLAVAQQTLHPVVRVGNWIEVGTDVFMHVIGSADVRYRTVHNFDFEQAIRDRTPFRDPGSPAHFDGTYAELRLGAEFRYQKHLLGYVLFEQFQAFDGELIDGRANASNPGATDIFGRAASPENPGFHVERYWIDYSFPGTPLRMRVGADLWTTDQAGLVGDDDPRLALFARLGDLELSAAAVIQNESQRLGLQNDNDFVYYTFGAGYSLTPHRFQLDVTYFRERFLGADTQAATGATAFRGQKTDSVLIMPSWSGSVGPVRALLQGNLLAGTSRGGTGVGLPAGAPASRAYDILAFAVVAYAEVELQVVRPFVGVIYGSGDGDPTDTKLHGFMTLPQRDITLISVTPFFAHLATSVAFQARDYGCPAQANVPARSPAVAAAASPLALGTAVLGGSGGNTADCAHTMANPLNDRIGNSSHLGLHSTYSNPGTLVLPAGLRLFPLKGHEITGWYVYRAMVQTDLLAIAFGPELNGRRLARTQYHELGGFWQWTLSQHFDFRLSGNVAIPGAGYRDLARLADCHAQLPGLQSCRGRDVALSAEARFRARF